MSENGFAVGGHTFGRKGGIRPHTAAKQRFGCRPFGTDTVGYFRTLPRVDLGMAIQLLTGHNGMRRHTSKFGEDRDDVECRLRGEEEEDARLISGHGTPHHGVQRLGSPPSR